MAYTSFTVDSSVNNIPTSFSTAAGSKVLSGAQITGQGELTIINETGTRLAVNVTGGDPTTAPTAVDFYVPAAVSGSFTSKTVDMPATSGVVYIKSMGSTISSGLVYGEIISR